MTRQAGNSASWSSPRQHEVQRFVRLQNIAARIGVLQSPIFPKNLQHYMILKAGLAADNAIVARDKMLSRIAERASVVKVGQFMNGKIVDDRYSTKEYGEIIWGEGAGESGTKIEWPSAAEMKLDGEVRAKSGLNRRLCLPKTNGPNGWQIEDWVAKQTEGWMAKQTEEWMAKQTLFGFGDFESKNAPSQGAEGFEVVTRRRARRAKRVEGGWFFAHGASDETDGEVPPPGGWRFDEKWLCNRVAWYELARKL